MFHVMDPSSIMKHIALLNVRGAACMYVCVCVCVCACACVRVCARMDSSAFSYDLKHLTALKSCVSVVSTEGNKNMQFSRTDVWLYTFSLGGTGHRWL